MASVVEERPRLVANQRLQAAPTGSLLPILILLFFFSGISSLIYQVLWLRLLALVFGVTIWAAATVLASFMAGLALGSFTAGRLVDRTRSPLVWFGLAEILVGLSALATQPAFQGLERLYATIYPSLPQALGPLTVLRFLLSFAILLVPTTIMGATLPIVVKSSLLRSEGLGARVSLLYATNTAGAVVGTLLAGFYLIGSIGITTSFQLAATINIAVGSLALIVSFARARRPAGALIAVDSTHQGGMQEASPDPAISARARRLVLLVFILSGACSLALEVIWFRVLVLQHQATTYAFTTILATVLFGIAAGSYLVAPLMRRQLSWLGVLAALELAIGVATLLSLSALTRTRDVLTSIGWLLRPMLPDEVEGVVVASALSILPVTLLMGIAFPIGLRLWSTDGTGDSKQIGQRIGLFYSLNVLGAIVGSLVAGFLLLPWLGSRLSLAAVASLSLLSGLLLLTVLSPSRRVVALGAAGVLAFLTAALILPDPFSVTLGSRYRGDRLLWHEEGLQGTVSVHRRPNGSHGLFIDGLAQAYDTPDNVLVHRMIGNLPMMLHPDPQDTLVIGLGGGTTAGAVSQHTGTSVDVVELSESAAHGTEWFRHVNYDVLRQPNVHLRIDDGRNFLLLTPKRYDVITADVIKPFNSGAGNLYAAEYFRLAHNALKDDGLMLQWVNRESPTQQKLITRTFLSVFPQTTRWQVRQQQGEPEQLLVGAKRPLQLSRAALESKWQNPTTREMLLSLGLPDTASLLAMYAAGPEELAQFVGVGPVLTDDRPVVEY
jgi:spermidine synthase